MQLDTHKESAQNTVSQLQEDIVSALSALEAVEGSLSDCEEENVYLRFRQGTEPDIYDMQAQLELIGATFKIEESLRL